MSFSVYGLLIGLSFVLTFWIFEQYVPKKSRSLESLMLPLALSALVGARIYHLVTDWELYQTASWRELFAVWNGGLGWIGAVIGGSIAIFLWNTWSEPRWTLRQLTDALAVAVPWGQALGRWGNFFNQEIFGPPTPLPWGMWIDPINRPEQFVAANRFHPLFLYESILLLGIGIFLHQTARNHPVGRGTLTGWYFFLAGGVRFLLEFLRIDSAPGPLHLSIAQWMTLGMMIGGMLILQLSRHPSQTLQ